MRDVEPIEEKLFADGKNVVFAPIASARDEAAVILKPRRRAQRALIRPRYNDRYLTEPA